jgi:O-acetyl-ADP-ribose deacetylase (regulator of RNase III)
LIKLLEGFDMFQVEADALAHGVNSEGIIGGLAKLFYDKYPSAMHEYIKLARKQQLSGGDLHAFEVSPGKWIYNLVSQDLPGPHASIKFIKLAIEKMFVHASKNGVKSINMPKIGSGIGGLNWNDVFETIGTFEEFAPEIELNICSLA